MANSNMAAKVQRPPQRPKAPDQARQSIAKARKTTAAGFQPLSQETVLRETQSDEVSEGSDIPYYAEPDLPPIPGPTNAEFVARYGSPPPLPELNMEDRLGIRDEITQCQGGAAVRTFIEGIHLSHTVRVCLTFDAWPSETPLPHRIFGLDEVDTFEKLKTAICENFGRELGWYMQVDSSAYVYTVKIYYPANPDSEDRSRQLLRECSPFPDGGRLYTFAATYLKSKITHIQVACCCDQCGNAAEIPEILVELKLRSKGLRPPKTKPKPPVPEDEKRKEPYTAREKNHMKECREEGIIHRDDIAIKRSDEDALNPLADHNDPSQSTIRVNSKVYRRMQDKLFQQAFQEDRTKARKARKVLSQQRSNAVTSSAVPYPIDDLPTKKHGRLVRKSALRKKSRTATPPPESSSDEDPPTKRHRVNFLKAAHGSDVGEAIDQGKAEKQGESSNDELGQEENDSVDIASDDELDGPDELTAGGVDLSTYAKADAQAIRDLLKQDQGLRPRRSRR